MPVSGSWWDGDPELARLRFDSALCGVVECRALTFVARRLTVEVEIEAGSDAAGGHAVRGRLVPAQAGTVALRHARGAPAAAAVDAEGRFALSVPPGDRAQGPVRLRVDTGSGLVVLTDPIEL